jgi:hypothetical protein
VASATRGGPDAAPSLRAICEPPVVRFPLRFHRDLARCPHGTLERFEKAPYRVEEPAPSWGHQGVETPHGGIAEAVISGNSMSPTS